jgi:hypothetical protein
MTRADSGYNRSLREGARRLSLTANKSPPLSGQSDVVRAWSRFDRVQVSIEPAVHIDSNSDSICGNA